MSDLLRTLAFAFRRKGSDALPGSELRLLLAYDLRWFAPEDAKRVVARGLELGLLVDRDGAVHPAFDPAKVDIPVNFRPSTHVLDEEAPANVPPPAPPSAPKSAPAPSSSAPQPPPAAAPTPPAAPAPAGPAHDGRAEAERARRGGLLSLEVAALVVARRDGEDVSQRLAEAEARVLRG